MADFDFREYARSRNSGGYPDYSYNPGASFSWRDFANNYSRIADANRQMQQASKKEDKEEPKKYRQMTELERISNASRVASDYIASYFGNKLFGTPDNPYTGEKGEEGIFGKPGVGEDINEFSLKNAPRFIANLPAMFVSSVPDTVAPITEFMAGTPAMEADYKTGLIEDRNLTAEEKSADLGYAGLSLLGFIAGPESKLVGGGLKGAANIAKRAGKADSAATKALDKMGNVQLRGNTTNRGFFETRDIIKGKTATELNPSRLKDAAATTAFETVFEGAQEAGQTYFEDMRYGQLDENTPKRMLDSALWGGLAGGIVGGVQGFGGAAIANSRAKRGLDKDGSKLPDLAPITQVTDDQKWYKFFDTEGLSENGVDPSTFTMTPEMQQLVLEDEGDRSDLTKLGSSMKGVVGYKGQKANDVILGTKAIRAQYNRNQGDDEKLTELAETWGYTKDEFDKIMQNNNDRGLAALLNSRAEEAYGKGPSQRIVLSSSRAPATKYGSHQTFFVRGVTAGNTISFAPGVPAKFGGDLDGDNYSIFLDPTMKSWAYLPTRKLMTPKAIPAKGSEGQEYLAYGSPEFDFEMAGISDISEYEDEYKNMVKQALDDVLTEYVKATPRPGDNIRNRVNALKGRLIKAFEVSSTEKKSGVTWQHKLAKALADISAEENSYEYTNAEGKTFTRKAAGDDLASDIILALSEVCAPITTLKNCLSIEGKAYEDVDAQIKASAWELAESKGDMGDKVSLMQILKVFGKLNYELSKKESPMFRFKQMSAWNAKFRQMSEELVAGLGFNRTTDVDDHVKWCMQMINDLHLPIDYAETLFIAKVTSDVCSALGMDGSPQSNKMGAGFDYKTFKEEFTRIWNRNADAFDEAARAQLTSSEYNIDEIIFGSKKSRIKEDQEESFARAVGEIFGGWSVSQFAAIDSTDQANNFNLAGLIDFMECSWTNFNGDSFGYVGGGFKEFVADMRKGYQGKYAAITSKVNEQFSSVKDMKAKLTLDENGYVKWAAEDDLEVSFFISALQNLFGLKVARWLGILGPGWVAHSEWGKFLLPRNKDPKTIKRAYIAGMTLYNWRDVIRAMESSDGNPAAAQAALSLVDFENPWNRFILTEMARYGEREIGEGCLSLTPLKALTDPTKGSYDDISAAFEQAEYLGVRKNCDMLLYFAAQTNETSLTGSDLSTRAQTAKNYISAINNSSVAKAREYVAQLRKLQEDSQRDGQVMLKAFWDVVTEYPNTIDTDMYATAIHDAGFASRRSSDKGKAGQSAGLHWNAVTNYLGGYSSAFIEQLGFSVGTIDSDMSITIAQAIRSAFIDKNYSQDVVISPDGKYVTITRDAIFKAAGIELSGQDPTWNEIMVLFEKAPQLLCQLMPQTFQQLSPDADTVTPVMVDTPANLVEEAIRNEGNPQAQIETQKKKVRNHLLVDQNSTILIFGSLDSRYGSLIREPARWCEAVDSAASEWSDFLYRVACIENEGTRKRVVRKHFGLNRASVARRTKEAIEELIGIFGTRQEKVLNRTKSKRIASKLATTRFTSRMEAFYAENNVDSNKQNEEESEETKKRRDGYKAEVKRRREALDISLALEQAYRSSFLGEELDFSQGEIDEDEISRHREFMRSIVVDGSRKWSDDEIESILSEMDDATKRKQFVAEHGRKIISRKDIGISVSTKEEQKEAASRFIEKVYAYYKGREYKRVQQDYLSLEDGGFENSGLEAWEEKVRKAFSWEKAGERNGVAVDKDGWTSQERREWLESQANFWNREMIAASLQKVYDTYGASTASDELIKMDEAEDFILQMVDEIRSDKSISRIASVDPDSISMPEMSFKNPATSPHIQAASIDLESGGVTVLSGQNAGSYQHLAILDFIQEDFSCPAPPQTGLTRDQAAELADRQQGRKLNYRNEDGSIGSVSSSDIRYKANIWTDERIAGTEWFPISDCLCGAACHNHNPRPVTDVSGDYIGGRYSLADLCWYLSERKVFKLKKKRNVFKKISHIIREAEDIKKIRFTGADVRSRQDLLNKIYEYQDKLAEHINNVFVEEKMDDEFGIDDARMIAQFMTPAIEIKYRDKDGAVVVDTISKWSLSSDAAFNEELDGINPVGIFEARPITMSIFSVCKKLSHDVLAALRNDENYQAGKNPKREDMNRYIRKSLSSWKGKAGNTDDILNFIQRSPVIKRAARRSRIVGSSPNSMQNWLANIGSVQNVGSYSVDSLISQAANYDETSAKIVKAINKNVKIENGEWVNGTIVIVGTEFSRLSPTESVPVSSRNQISSWKELDQVKEDFSVPGAINAVLIPELYEKPSQRKMKGLWNKAAKRDKVFLVPVESKSNFEEGIISSGVSREEVVFSENGRILVNGKEHILYNPLAGKSLTSGTSYPSTHLQLFDPFSEIFVSFQDYGELGTDDSGSLGAPPLAALKMPFSDTLTFSEDVLFANAPTGAKLRGGRFRTVDLDDSNSYKENETIRQSLMTEIKERLTGIGPEGPYSYGPQRIILPKFGETYDPESDEVYLKAVQAYLEKKPEELQSDGTIKGPVRRGECFNILCIEKNGEAYFFPLIFGSGKGTPVLDHVYLDASTLLTGRDMSVSFRFDGALNFEEAEGIKMIFPTFAYKTYTRLATQEEYEKFARCGIDITITSRRTGEKRKLSTSIMYSGQTEANRLVDAGFQKKLENLGNLQKIVPHHYFRDKFAKRDEKGNFLKDDDGNYIIDSQKCIDAKARPDVIRRMCDINDIGIWRDFAFNDVTIMIHEDPIVNGIMRKVAQAALACDMRYPLLAFGNLINDEIIYADWNHNLVFGILTDNELERFFYALDERFCYDGAEEQANPTAYNRGGRLPWIDRDGRILSVDENGEYRYREGHIHFLRPTDDSSMLGQPSGKAKFGVQSILNESLIHGIQNGGDFSTLIEYMRAREGDPSNYIGLTTGRYDEPFWVSKTEKELAQMAARFDYERNVDRRLLKRNHRPYREAKRRWLDISRQFSRLRNKEIEFVDVEGKPVDIDSRSDKDALEYQRAMRRWRDFFDDMEHPFTTLEIHNIFRDMTGSTYNASNGSHSITVGQFVTWMNGFLDKLENHESPFEGGLTVTGRPILPYVTSETLDRFLSSEKFRTSPENKTWERDALIKAMKEELDKTFVQLRYMSFSQREAVYKCIDYIGGTYGEYEVTRPIGEYGLHLVELLENNDPLYTVCEGIGMNNIRKRKEQTAAFVKKLQEAENKRGKTLIPTDSEVTGFMASVKTRGDGTKWNILSAVSRACSCVTGVLGPSAAIGRYLTQGQNRLYMYIHHNLTKGYISTNNPGIEVKDRAAVRAISKDKNVQMIWRAMNVLSLTGEDIIQIQRLDSAEKMAAYLEDRVKKMSWQEKFQNKAFNWASGGRFGVDRQIENWIDRLGMMLNEENAPELSEKVGPKGETLYEMLVKENPENFMIDFLTTRDDNPYFLEATQARNWVVNREHNGQSIAGLILTDAFRRSPMGKFFMVTGLCKFPHYAYEVGGWFLNHFAPISSVVYLLRSAAINYAANSDTPLSQYLDSLGIERTQIYQNLKEAIINDSLMMGSTALAALLFSIGAIEPPDDEYYEEYAGNPGEWTICGFRLAENWWLMDVLGPFGAMACTWQSVIIGKPRFDLLTNWLSQSLWSNPIVKMGDVVQSLLDPTESYLDEYDNIANQYDAAEDGAPSILEWAGENLFTMGLNWFGNAFTPTLIKEISRSREFQQHERSYKKIKNAEGEEVRTSYFDSQIRKITRNNLALGLLVDAVTALGGRDYSGYVATEMPEVKIPDANQLDSIRYYSLTNEDGSEKDEAEKQMLAFDIISLLYSTDDIGNLVENGFVIPMETRVYVSQVLNDMKQLEVDEYNDWVQKTGKSAYIVGQGDTVSGTIKISQITEAYYDDLAQIDKVFDKLWSEDLSKGLQMYYRLPTTYARTTSGEIYATGYAPSLANSLPLPIPIPWITARGTDNAWFGVGTRDEGTLGKAGNWETESEVVPGVSAGGRNLVPIPADRTVRPKLSDFGDDENGGYSNTESGKQLASSRSSNSTGLTYSSSSYPYSGRSGGSGGGGGGGRSYTPNFYSPSVSLPRTNSSRIMNTDRAIKPNYDYLRPDFETKGSREAYRRSDI